jgi:MFS family permease
MGFFPKAWGNAQHPPLLLILMLMLMLLLKPRITPRARARTRCGFLLVEFGAASSQFVPTIGLNAPTLTPPPAATLSALRSFPRPVWILCVGTFLNKFGTFVIPFLALYLTRQGFSLAAAGLAISAYGLGQLIACGIGGHLADSIGRRKTIVVSMFFGAACMLALSQARSLESIVFLTALTGFASELYRPAASALLTDLVPPEQRVTAFAAYRLALNAGWAFGPATAGLLSKYSFFWLFVGDAATSVLYGVVAWFALPHGVRNSEEQSHWREAWSVMRRDRPFQQMLLSSFAIGLVFLQMGSTFGLHVTGLGFSDAVYGALLSLNGVLVVLCELPLTSVTQRFQPRRAMMAGYLLIAMGFGLNAWATGIPGLALGMTIFTLGEIYSMPVASGYVSALAPAHMRGRYWGAMGFTWALAQVIGPTLGMALFGFSPALLWISCGVLGVLAAALISAHTRGNTDEHTGAQAMPKLDASPRLSDPTR